MNLRRRYFLGPSSTNTATATGEGLRFGGRATNTNLTKKDGPVFMHNVSNTRRLHSFLDNNDNNNNNNESTPAADFNHLQRTESTGVSQQALVQGLLRQGVVRGIALS